MSHQKNMSREIAGEVYDVLVEICGANDNDREHFISRQTADVKADFSFQPPSEWRFQGLLGFGGKFWRVNRRWRVDCYPEDMTKAKDILILEANVKLKALREKA